MTLLLALLTLLCNGTISAADNAAAADVKTAANANASASMTDLQAVAARATTQFASMMDTIIAAAADEPDMKVASAVAHVLPSGPVQSPAQTSGETLTRDQMREQYAKIARRGYPKLVTSPDELIAHVTYAVEELAEYLKAEAKSKGIALDTMPISEIREMGQAPLRRFIAFPEGPTMYDLVQMARARYRNRDSQAHLRVVVGEMLRLLDEHARFQLMAWMKANNFAQERIKFILGEHAVFQMSYESELAVARQGVTDPAVILELIEKEAALFLTHEDREYGYGDVYNIAFKIIRTIKLPKDETAISSMRWVNALFAQKYSDKPATPSSSLCYLLIHHIKQVCSQRIYVSGYSADEHLQQMLEPEGAEEHLVAADKKLFQMSLTLNTNKCLFDCYGTRFEMLRKFLQGKAIGQGGKVLSLERPFLSMQDYMTEQIDALIEAPQNPRAANPGMVHRYALLDLAVAQDPIDIITAYCTEPGWSIEYADKMEKQRSFCGPLVKTGSYNGCVFLYLDRRGVNSLKGFGTLFDTIKCDVLEIKYNPLSELTAPLLKPLTRCPGLRLKFLSLSHNNLSRMDFAELANIRTLTNLSVADNEISSVDGIDQLIPQLASLDISNNRLDESMCKKLQSLWEDYRKPGSNIKVIPQKINEKAALINTLHTIANRNTAVAERSLLTLTDLKQKLRKKRDKARRPNGE